MSTDLRARLRILKGEAAPLSAPPIPTQESHTAKIAKRAIPARSGNFGKSATPSVDDLPTNADTVGDVQRDGSDFARRVVTEYTKPGAVVLDPAAKDLTVAKAAIDLDRKVMAASRATAPGWNDRCAVYAEDASAFLATRVADWVRLGQAKAPFKLIVSDLTGWTSAADKAGEILPHAPSVMPAGGTVAFRLSLADIGPVVALMGGKAAVEALDDGSAMLVWTFGPDLKPRKPVVKTKEQAGSPRITRLKSSTSPRTLTTTSLFAGAGGMTAGLEKAGITSKAALDIAKAAMKTFKANFPAATALIRSIIGLDPTLLPDTDIIDGGPPCTKYSAAGGRQGEDHPDGRLVYEYLRFIAAKSPKAFVFENVRGLLDRKHRRTFKRLIAEFEALGYVVTWRLLNAADFGAAQTRERVIIVGIRSDLGIAFDFDRLQKVERRPTQREAIWHLRGQARVHRKGIKATGHEYNACAFSSRYLAGVNVRGWDQPSYTCIANSGGAPLHPDPVPEEIAKSDPNRHYVHIEGKGHFRRITPKEAAALQGFPEDFVFKATSMSNYYRQVGNAVPVPLAEAIGKALRDTLLEALDRQEKLAA